MTEPTKRPKATRTKNILIVGVLFLALLITLGFNRGWLAWHSDQRPVGRLRPVDLASQTSAPRTETISSDLETSSSLPATILPGNPTGDDDPSNSTSDDAGNHPASSAVDHDQDQDHDADD